MAILLGAPLSGSTRDQPENENYHHHRDALIFTDESGFFLNWPKEVDYGKESPDEAVWAT